MPKVKSNKRYPRVDVILQSDSTPLKIEEEQDILPSDSDYDSDTTVGYEDFLPSQSQSQSHSESVTVINLIIIAHGELPDMQTYNSRSNDKNQNISSLFELTRPYTDNSTDTGIHEVKLNNIMVDETGECSRYSVSNIKNIQKQLEENFHQTGSIIDGNILDFLNSIQSSNNEHRLVTQLEEKEKYKLDMTRYEEMLNLYYNEKERYEKRKLYSNQNGFPPPQPFMIKKPIKPDPPRKKNVSASNPTFQFKLTDPTKIYNKRYTQAIFPGVSPPFIIYTSDVVLSTIIERQIYSYSLEEGPNLFEFISTILRVCSALHKTNVEINIIDLSCNDLQNRGNAKIPGGGKKYRNTRRRKETRRKRRKETRRKRKT